MGMAHSYAELERRLVHLREELKFIVLGRVVGEIVTVAGGEPRLSIGELQLPEEHALRLAAWIQRVFQGEEATHPARSNPAEGGHVP